MAVRSLEVNHGTLVGSVPANVFNVAAGRTLIVKQVQLVNLDPAAAAVYLSRDTGGSDGTLLWTGMVPSGGLTHIAGTTMLTDLFLVINQGDTLYIGQLGAGTLHWHLSGAYLAGTFS